MMKWLLVVYKVPPEPSTARVYAWRKLKGLGGLYIQQSVCILPYTQQNSEGILDIEKDMQKYGGEFWHFIVEQFDEKTESKLINQYNELRDREYEEIADKCNDFYAEIEKETKNENFTYAELEENEDELEKLCNWFCKVVKRDLFGASKKGQVEGMLEQCKKLLEEFAQRVYNTEES
ncbi:Chromate resistance protein ChrB [Caldanaerobius polysaccharolyticus]|uniref:Chromate resistance protein ChrB n=1 Tax=Caldanaerobius polysaccharolyticus TaxID=44256 RepID=UPI001FDFD032|nr:Chromate resistance protein ChrB [Caldanaerobius polysaccharolyticus]